MTRAVTLPLRGIHRHGKAPVTKRKPITAENRARYAHEVRPTRKCICYGLNDIADRKPVPGIGYRCSQYLCGLEPDDERAARMRGERPASWPRVVGAKRDPSRSLVPKQPGGSAESLKGAADRE